LIGGKLPADDARTLAFIEAAAREHLTPRPVQLFVMQFFREKLYCAGFFGVSDRD